MIDKKWIECHWFLKPITDEFMEDFINRCRQDKEEIDKW